MGNGLLFTSTPSISKITAAGNSAFVCIASSKRNRIPNYECESRVRFITTLFWQGTQGCEKLLGRQGVQNALLFHPSAPRGNDAITHKFQMLGIVRVGRDDDLHAFVARQLYVPVA